MEIVLENHKSGQFFPLKTGNLSFGTLSPVLEHQKFYKMVGVLIKILEIFLSTFEVNRFETDREIGVFNDKMEQ
jgi:hypothetical protein